MATLSAEDIHHLYRRAGFGIGVAQATAMAGIERDTAIEQLLVAPLHDAVPQPSFSSIGSDWERFVAAKHWVYDQAATTATPLADKLALCWHGHFCSAAEKVGWQRMWDQWQLFRLQGLGDLRQLTTSVSLGPAMLEYLDNRWNRRGVVQENFARELWELFLLGPGNYTQDEVVESARAWTGHTLEGDPHAGTERHVFRSDWHDPGPVTIFGVTGSLDGPGLIELTFRQRAPQLATHIARKLWSFFAYPAGPTDPGVGVVAAALQARWSVVDALRALFHHDGFWSDTACNGLVRSPFEYVVAVMKATGLTAERLHPEWFENDMGQELFNPPNVSGWRPNGYWLSATACYQRAWLARHAMWKATADLRTATGNDHRLFADELKALPPDQAVVSILQRFGVSSTDPATTGVLVQFVETERAERSWAEPINLSRLVMASPEFQLA